MLRWLPALALAGLVPAQTVVLAVQAKAGAVARRGSPALASFPWPDELADALTGVASDWPVPWTATLVEADANAEVPCEVVAIAASAAAAARGELRFLVAELPADAERRYRLTLGASPRKDTGTFAATTQDTGRILALAGVPLLRHDNEFDRDDLERTSKPGWHLLLPGSEVQLTKGPGGKYPHHRGLFLGWNETVVGDATFDYWQCQEATQRHAGYEVPREVRSAVRADLATSTHWLSPLDEPIVRERRTTTAWQPVGETGVAPLLIDVTIELSADQVVALRGDPQHAGFQIRVADEVAQRNDARYVRPLSATGGKDDVWSDCPWVAGLFTIEGRRVAIAHLSHPGNPQPVQYATRPYGRFGAYFTAELAPSTPLHLRYRIVVVPMGEDTDVGVARFSRDWADFAEPIAVEVGR